MEANWALYWSVGVLIFLGGVLYKFERTHITARELSLIMVLATLAGVGRVPFGSIPSVQPTTFIVMMAGFVFGPLRGFIVGIVATLISNCFLGHGTWTLWQMLAWGLCGMSLGWVGLKSPKLSIKILAAIGFLWGFIFGWLTNVWDWLAFVYPLTWESWWGRNVLSAWFDFTHGVVNAALILVLGSWFLKLLRKYQQKLRISQS